MDWDAVRTDALRAATDRVAESYEASMRQISYDQPRMSRLPKETFELEELCEKVIRETGIQVSCNEALRKADEALVAGYRRDEEIRDLKARIDKLCRDKPEMRNVANQTEKRRVSFENSSTESPTILFEERRRYT